MVVKCENVRIPWNVTDFGSITLTNGEIKINVINAHVRTVLDQIENIPSYTTKSSVTDSLCSL